ncbi:hypothetical protein V8G54_026678 [Vigna mungo]|uniref:Uncharacterized protein n=1 Tax=Vigna mungo TaxID=3915 RepID=A0AAQ3RMD3_VIGMU
MIANLLSALHEPRRLKRMERAASSLIKPVSNPSLFMNSFSLKSETANSSSLPFLSCKTTSAIETLTISSSISAVSFTSLPETSDFGLEATLKLPSNLTFINCLCNVPIFSLKSTEISRLATSRRPKDRPMSCVMSSICLMGCFKFELFVKALARLSSFSRDSKDFLIGGLSKTVFLSLKSLKIGENFSTNMANSEKICTSISEFLAREATSSAKTISSDNSLENFLFSTISISYTKTEFMQQKKNQSSLTGYRRSSIGQHTYLEHRANTTKYQNINKENHTNNIHRRE